MLGKEFGITQKNLAFACISPTFASLWGGWRTRSRVLNFRQLVEDGEPIQCDRGCLAAPTSLPYMSCFILYLSNFLGLCAFLIHLNLNHWSKLYSPRWSNTNGNQINYQMKAKEVAIISLLFDSDRRWRAAWVITTCPRNFSCLSTTHKFIPSKKILKYHLYHEVTRCHMSCRSGGYPKIKCISFERSRWEDYFWLGNHGWIPSGYRDLDHFLFPLLLKGARRPPPKWLRIWL